jgi:hypothetical protein
MSMANAGGSYYDCGADIHGRPFEATVGRYTILVTGDSTASQVKISGNYAAVVRSDRVAFIGSKAPTRIECTSTSVGEFALAARIRRALGLPTQ